MTVVPSPAVAPAAPPRNTAVAPAAVAARPGSAAERPGRWAFLLGRPGRAVGRVPVLGAVTAVVLLAAVTGCARAEEAEPESTLFGYAGTTLDVVVAHHVPTDLVTADRQDIKVTRWFKADVVGTSTTDWRLEGDTLHLEASCSGLADCDARFRVEVPPHVAVLRDGRATDLKGRPS
ncbi:hypothetical protein PUR61_10015 [Streptomyces sp. BE20]|uniref:hypothetical protein n=1 Tax=Streptomyces sp. BE20 TaxID=3002525 RepID=UPI002E7A7EF3|nr:hypothetical protein [Streptomyces sp. BE20]MEE1822524.1 hypothetical protein [Streptomyces sp. BE20]